MIPVGFTIQPEERYLELLDSVIREVPDYLELSPETTWRSDPAGGFAPTDSTSTSNVWGPRPASPSSLTEWDSPWGVPDAIQSATHIGWRASGPTTSSFVSCGTPTTWA